MKEDSRLFFAGNLAFWSILLVLIFLILPFMNRRFFDEERITMMDRFHIKGDSLQLTFDSTKTIGPDSLLASGRKKARLTKKDSVKIARKDPESTEWYIANFKWKDFDNRNHELSFRFDKAEFNRAAVSRKNENWWSEEGLYRDLITASRVPLDSMTKAMVRDIKIKQLYGNDILNYVVTAIQTPLYTLVSSSECPDKSFGREWIDDCSPREDGKGCCSNVMPYGVFSPAEFIVQKTGDCDTKSLIAYAILKRMGFDVALIIGDVNLGRHAMLGVANVQPERRSRYVRHQGRIYYPWEVTGYYPENRLGNMNMWPAWNNWYVSLN